MFRKWLHRGLETKTEDMKSPLFGLCYAILHRDRRERGREVGILFSLSHTQVKQECILGQYILTIHTEKCPRYCKKQVVWVSEFRSVIGQCVSRGTGCEGSVDNCRESTSPSKRSQIYKVLPPKMCSCLMPSFPCVSTVPCCTHKWQRCATVWSCHYVWHEAVGVRTFCAFWVCNKMATFLVCLEACSHQKVAKRNYSIHIILWKEFALLSANILVVFHWN